MPSFKPSDPRGAGALVAIDLQEGFRHPRWGRRNQPGLESSVGTILEAWRARGFPVIHVLHRSLEPDSPLRPGQPGTEPMSCARPLPGEAIFEKSVHSAFIGTGLETWLRARDLQNLSLIGMTSDHCVSTSARMGADLGFEITLIEDGLATFDRVARDGRVIPAELVHEVSLASLSREFARVISL